MLYIATEIVEERPAAVSQRAWEGMKRAGMTAVADYWHEKILPRHFTPEAKAKYHHQKRNVYYLLWKTGASRRAFQKPGQLKAALGGVVDNVLSGAMLRQLAGRELIKAYPNHVTLTMQGPRYMTMRPFHGDRKQAVREKWGYGYGQTFNPDSGQQPDKVKEISTVLASEQEELAKVFDATVNAGLRDYRERRVSAA